MNPWKAGAGAGLGIAAGMMAPNTSGAYNDYANEMDGYSKSYDPYIDSGRLNMGRLNAAYGHMQNNPTAEMDEIAQHFTLSPAEQTILSHTKNMMNQNASSTGLLGSTAANSALQGKMSGDVGQFLGNYVQQGLGQYDKSLDGMSGMFNTGYNALNQQNQMEQEAALGRAKGSLANDQWNSNIIADGIGMGGKAGGLF